MGISLFHIVKIINEDKKSENLNKDLINKAIITIDDSTNNKHNNLPETTKENIPIKVDFNLLTTENKDIIAWIYCPDTPINYPIVKGNDNSYYLNRLLDGTNNPAGTLFADYRCAADFSDLNTVVYGHNMKNDTMFGILPNYKKQDYYEKHSVWYLSTPDKDYKIELIAGYVTPSNSNLYNIGNSREERDIQISNAINNSTFTSNLQVLETDKLITLSTCSNEYENARFVLLGVLKEVI